MSVPVKRLGRLSIQDMPTMTQLNVNTALSIPRSHPRDMNEPGHSAAKPHGINTKPDQDEEDDCDEDDDSVIQSPTSLYYNLEHLPAQNRAAVRDVFQEPPKIALQRCRRIGDTYAFQMTELVTRSVRIRAPTDIEENRDRNGPYPTCSCGQSDSNAPCPHLIWLLDQLLNQTLYEHDKTKPLHMTRAGYAQEMGDPFQNISDFDLHLLADGLHCPVVDPEAAYASSEEDEVEEEIDYHRVLEARELLAGVYSVTPEEFRPDIFDPPSRGPPVLKDNDLDGTVFRMLLDNHRFFQYFLSLARPADPINDLFRKLSQRVDRVLRDLDTSLRQGPPSPSVAPAVEKPLAESDSEPPSETQTHTKSQLQVPSEDDAQTPAGGEQQRDVAWAAKHLLGIVKLIRSAIYTREEPLHRKAALSAARTLVHILASVVARDLDNINSPKKGKPESIGSARADRNLYLRLIGDSDTDFVLAELNLLPEAASHLVDSLEAILEQIGVRGAPPSYVDRFRKLVTRLRSSSAGTGLKRHVRNRESEDQRGAKRMK